MLWAMGYAAHIRSQCIATRPARFHYIEQHAYNEAFALRPIYYYVPSRMTFVYTPALSLSPLSLPPCYTTNIEPREMMQVAAAVLRQYILYTGQWQTQADRDPNAGQHRMGLAPGSNLLTYVSPRSLIPPLQHPTTTDTYHMPRSLSHSRPLDLAVSRHPRH